MLLFNKTNSGLAISVIIVGSLLAASTGIVGASVVTLGLLTYPVLVKMDTHRKLHRAQFVHPEHWDK